MGSNNTKIQALIESAFIAVLDKLEQDGSANQINDLHVQIDRESGELSIFSEDEQPLGKIVIFDWVENKQPEEVFNKHAESVIKSALVSLASKEVFDRSCIAKPFSVNLSDEEFTDIEELLFIDDELLRLDDPLLKDMDADLDDFLEKLLSDIE
ncbi:hypothetical protein [Massilibacteroides sp.]|uniref:hypothetical protein n=1 Tax=Massilibacteroides sp. TaxID=2034766 RepID=UPI0026153E9C|nr:hypothetical protein [Massilibacteroides sp.]MDD4514060.1 hypothetical protein [Massilibacteroides sp.]